MDVVLLLLFLVEASDEEGTEEAAAVDPEDGEGTISFCPGKQRFPTTQWQGSVQSFLGLLEHPLGLIGVAIFFFDGIYC
jgi:hypothetical protein